MASVKKDPPDNMGQRLRYVEESKHLTIRPIKPDDRNEWLRLRCALWPGDDAEHGLEIDRFFLGQIKEPLAVLVAEQGKGRLIGFAELSIRHYAEGCSSDQVAYLEGWYVVPDERGSGIGRCLMEAAEAWAICSGR